MGPNICVYNSLKLQSMFKYFCKNNEYGKYILKKENEIH
jgi:hypothetical protein